MDNVFMASAIDLNGCDINTPPSQKYDHVHSEYKEEVGQRLSLGAFSLAYNISVDYAAPRVSSVQYLSPDGIVVELVS
jgi:hypothetical protein